MLTSFSYNISLLLWFYSKNPFNTVHRVHDMISLKLDFSNLQSNWDWASQLSCSTPTNHSKSSEDKGLLAAGRTSQGPQTKHSMKNTCWEKLRTPQNVSWMMSCYTASLTTPPADASKQLYKEQLISQISLLFSPQN